MSKYIDRDVLLKHLEHLRPHPGGIGLEYVGARCMFQSVIMEIKLAKKEDVAPVVHGRWINNDYDKDIVRTCSFCKRSVNAFTYRFCPYCGSKMDESEESDNV